jgi:hypothetical protein
MSGTSLALKIGSLVLGLGTFMVMFQKVKGLKKYGLSSLFYVLLASLILALSTLLLLLKPSVNELTTLISAQLAIIAAGTLHVITAGYLLPWYTGQKFSMQLVFIICILLFGYFFFNLSFTFLVEPGVDMVWYLSLLWFLVPALLNETALKLLDVPPKEYKMWEYPVNVRIDDPSDEEMENPVVISFVFNKQTEAPETTTFRAKAPMAMSLGRLFYFFINDYNSRHPEGPVSYTGINNEPDQWVFFKVNNKLLKLKTALDPDETILKNKIRENDVLVCNRVSSHNKLTENETAE